MDCLVALTLGLAIPSRSARSAAAILRERASCITLAFLARLNAFITAGGYVVSSVSGGVGVAVAIVRSTSASV